MRTSGEALETYVAAFNDRDYRVWGPRIMTAQSRWRDQPTGQMLVGPAGQSQLVESFLSSVPDGTMAVCDMHAGPGFAVAEMVGRGVVSNGPTPRLPVTSALLRTVPAGTRIEVSFCMVVALDNGRIADSRIYWSARQLAEVNPCPAEIQEALTARERDVAIYASTGLYNHEIAKLLGSSPNTVRNQLASVFRKLDVSTRAELAWLMSRSTDVP